MASGAGRRQGKSRNWMASALKVAGLGLAAAYALKQAYDYFQGEGGATPDPARPTASSPRRSQTAPGRNSKSRQNHDGGADSTLEVGEDAPQLCSKEELLEKLADYQQSYVQIPEETSRECLATLDHVRDRLDPHLEQAYGAKLLSGETAGRQRSRVVYPHCLELLLPLPLDPNLWEAVDGAATLLETPGYYLIRRRNLEFFEKGASPFDPFVVGGYLSPVALKRHLCRLVREEITWTRGHPLYGSVRPVYSGSDVVLEVQCDGRARLTVRVEPFVALPGVTLDLVGRPHPGASSLDQHSIRSPYSNLWRQSFRRAEDQRLEAMEDTQLACLQLLEAVRLNNAPLQTTLTAHHFRMLFFRLADEHSSGGGWQGGHLLDRLVDFLRELGAQLERGSIPHYFDPQVNLLEGHDPEQLTSVSHWIAFVLGDELGNLVHLLKKEYHVDDRETLP